MLQQIENKYKPGAEAETEIVMAVFQNSPDKIHERVAQNDPVNAKSSKGIPLITLTVIFGFEESMDALLQYKVKINNIDHEGFHVLHRCVMYGRLEMIPKVMTQKILKEFPSPRFQRTALAMAAMSDHPLAVEMASALLDFGCNINAKDYLGDRPLMLAIKERNFPMIEMFISRGASLTKTNDLGINAVDYAEREGVDITHLLPKNVKSR